MSHFSFPLLKNENILSCMTELGIGMVEKELIEPEKNIDMVRRVFHHLIELCLGVTKDEINQPAFSGLQTMNYPDLHEDSIPHLNSLRQCQKLMGVCGINDFGLKDLSSPTSKRFRRQLSAVINFAKFREEKLIILDNHNSQRDVLQTQLRKAEARRTELTKELAVRRAQTQEESNAIAELESDCRDKENRIEKLNVQQAELRDQANDVKATSGQLKVEINAQSEKLDELLATKKKLQSLVINSPEKFKRQLVEVSQALDSEMAESKKCEKKIRELNTWSESIDEALTDVSTGFDTLNDVIMESEHEKSENILLSKLLGQIQLNGETMKQVDLMKQQLARKLTRSEEKLGSLRKQSETRLTESQKSLEQLHVELLEATGFKKSIMQRAEAMELKVLGLRRPIEAERLAQEQEREEMKDAYLHLEKTVVGHLKQLQHALEDTPAPPLLNNKGVLGTPATMARACNAV